MPGTVDDFMSRFGGNQTVDDQQAAQYHDKFVSQQPGDQQFDSQTYHQAATEYLGKMPDDQFHQAATNALAQALAEERHSMLSGLMGALAGGAGAASPASGLLGALEGGGGSPVAGILGALSGGGAGASPAGGLGALAAKLGLSSTDPAQMSNDEAARVVNYARQEQPQALQQTVQDKPWFVKAMGSPVLMGVLAAAASKMASR